MNKTKFFKVLQLISSLVIIAVIATGAYFGYGLYKEYKIDQAAKAEHISPSTPDTQAESSNAESSQESSIDWDKIRANAKNDTKEQVAVQEPVIKTLAPPKKQAKKQKPKLAIIMDDLAYKSQLNDLQKLNLPITPSFFPVSPDSPDTAKLAASTPFYMVHLPLEAQNPQHSRQKWILVGSNQDEIRAQIATIKEQFPRLMFLNNHTGSKFTASEPDMANLLQVLGEFGIEFVDSRTSADTAAPKLYKQASRPLLSRDVFLDNTPSVSYTTDQLKLAIKIAKKKGYAIAICHPHKSTFKALANAKHSLFKEVELVYIKDLSVARTLLAQNLPKTPPKAPTTETSTLAHTPESTAPILPSAPSQLPNAQTNAPKDNAPDTTQKDNGIAGLFDSAQGGEIPHNAYLDHTPSNEPLQADSSSPAPLETLLEAPEAQEAQAPAPQTAQAQTPPTKEPIPKPSKIDTTMFKEAKRVSNEQRAKAKPAQPPKPKVKSEKSTTKTYESSQDCAQNEVEAFVSGCPSDKAKKKQGFIDIKWNGNEQNPSKKPKDFLDSSDLDSSL